MKTNFEKELESLINRYSKENDSDTPDFILAKYLNACLDNFSTAINDREKWYGRIKNAEDLHYKIPFKFDDDTTYIRSGNFSAEVEQAITNLQKAGDEILKKLKD